MTIDEVISVLEMQEEILQFSHFTNADAWTLGNMLVAEAQRRGASVMISIRLNNGFTVFQYGFDGTNLYNENWISRKQKTVMVTEKSKPSSGYGSPPERRNTGRYDDGSQGVRGKRRRIPYPCRRGGSNRICPGFRYGSGFRS